MARAYAGILGPLAWITSIVCGLLRGDAAESVMWTAWLALLAFSAVGYALGWIAGSTVESSVSSRISAELAEHEASEATAASGNA